jgi:hypothetical protein
LNSRSRVSGKTLALFFAHHRASILNADARLVAGQRSVLTESNIDQIAGHLYCCPYAALSFIMLEQDHPRFWRIKSPESNKVTESYCLDCSSFVGASQSVINLRLVELLHLTRCKQKTPAAP